MKLRFKKFLSLIDEDKKLITIYAVVDQRQDYLSIVRGL